MIRSKQRAEPSGQSAKRRFRFHLVTLAVLITSVLLMCESIWQIADWASAAVWLFPCAVCCVCLFFVPGLATLVQRGSTGKRVITVVVGMVGAGLVAEGSARLYFAGDRNGFESVRARLAGKSLPQTPYLGQPYLLYVLRPGRYGENYHNEQGYRGEAVPMERTRGVARVLCLGGSTTYGYGAPNYKDAYPAQLQQILRRQLPAGVQGVEVINAGLPFGTTAELLTHYHFKFHYFRPDLVIIQTGGNESLLIDPGSLAAAAKYYQPDYSHWRKPLQLPQPLSPLGRLAVKSRFAAWLVILLLQGSSPGNMALTRPPGLPPPTVWHPAAKTPGLAASIPDAQLAFTHNLSTLIDMCSRDGAKVLLVPFRPAPGFETKGGSSADLRHERIVKRIAEERRLTLAPFPASVISAGNWIDQCHLNPAGCREKAEYLAPFAKRLLWP